MQTEKIDVCVVTRDGKIPKGLEYIPLNNLIVETVKPIGVARMVCISKVTTKVFAFIDDDIEIDRDWYGALAYYMQREDVGAVWGSTHIIGFSLAKYSYDVTPFKEMKPGEGLNTNNTLIKTELVKDWVPTYGTYCHEDLDLGNHILKKKRIFVIPTNSAHVKSWSGLRNSAVWAGHEYSEAYSLSGGRIAWEYFRRLLGPFKVALLRGVPYAIVSAYRNFWFIIGMMKKRVGM